MRGTLTLPAKGLRPSAHPILEEKGTPASESPWGNPTPPVVRRSTPSGRVYLFSEAVEELVDHHLGCGRHQALPEPGQDPCCLRVAG